MRSQTVKKEEDKIEWGLQKELYSANSTRYHQDKMQCLKDYLREIGEDPDDYSQEYLERMLENGFMD